MCEKSIPREQAGLVRRQKRAVGTPLTSLAPALVERSLSRWQEKRTMHKPEV